MHRMLLWMFCLLVLPAQSALAWGWLGHELVAELAEQQLSPAAREEALRLLAIEDSHSLAEVSAWADRVREDEAYRWSIPLHFVNFPGQACPREGATCANGDCVIGAINRFRARLGDRSLGDAERLEALKFLVHFVGDIHQPLHAGRAEDKGGNTYQTQWKGKGGNLHGLWDYELLASRALERPEYAVLLQQLPAVVVGSVDPVDWAMDSCAIVNAAGFYPPHKVPPAYVERQRPQAELRIRMAAAELARDLNTLLAPAAVASAAAD